MLNCWCIISLFSLPLSSHLEDVRRKQRAQRRRERGRERGEVAAINGRLRHKCTRVHGKGGQMKFICVHWSERQETKYIVTHLSSWIECFGVCVKRREERERERREKMKVHCQLQEQQWEVGRVMAKSTLRITCDCKKLFCARDKAQAKW